MPLRFVFACDSFKGTLSSSRTAELLTDAALQTFPGAECYALPMADGGEGTVEAVVSAAGGHLVHAEARDPLGRSITAGYALLPGHRAVIEVSAASGLPLLSPSECNPLHTSSFGTGQLIAHALGRGARDITVALGGSATNDGGMGILRALGARFLDTSGRALPGTGADLARVASIDLSGLDRRLGGVSFHAMCDVDSPLLGPNGASRLFGPQKGATTADVLSLEEGMSAYARRLANAFGRPFVDSPGFGAAGGIGAALRLAFGADVASGVERVLDLVGFNDVLAGADLCITGEGHADAQTAHGKVVSGVAWRCRAAGVPCVAIVGGMEPGATELAGFGVDALVPTVIDATILDEALAHAEENFGLAAARVFSLLALGMRMRGDAQ